MPPPTPSTARARRRRTRRCGSPRSARCPRRATPNRLCRNIPRGGAAPIAKAVDGRGAFGVPVTDAGGKVASSSAAIGISTATRAATVDTRCHTPGAGRTASSSGTVTVPVTATRPRSLRTRSTIMMFSATSLTDARSAAGGMRSGSVPLIGLDVTVVTGAAQEQFRRQRRHRTPVARDDRPPGPGRFARRRRRRNPAGTASARR